MPTRRELQDALKRAAEAGDVEAANEIAEFLDNTDPYQKALEGMSGLDKFAVGAGESFADFGLGLTNLFADTAESLGFQTADPTARREAAETIARTKMVDDPYKTAGGIATDIAMTAVPAGRVAAMSKTVPGVMAGEGVLAGLYEGAKESQDAGDAAVSGGLAATGAGVLGGLASAGGKVARTALDAAFPVSDDARKLMGEGSGVRLTPGMARPALAPLERLMARTPVLNQPTQGLQNQALTDWNERILNQVSPGTVTETGADGFKQIQEQFGFAYDRLWDIDLPENQLRQLRNSYQTINVNDEVTDAYRPLARKTLKQVDDLLRNGNLQQAERTIREAAQRAEGIDRDFFDGLQKTLFNTLPDKTKEAVTGLNKQYRDFMTATRAGSYVDASERGGVFTPRQVLGASKARSTPRQTSAGEGSLQQEALQASRVMTEAMPRMNATELDAAGAPLITAGAAAVDPLGTGVALGVGRGLVNEAARRQFVEGGQTGLRKAVAALGGLSAQAVEEEIARLMYEIQQYEMRLNSRPTEQRALASALRGRF